MVTPKICILSTAAIASQRWAGALGCPHPGCWARSGPVLPRWKGVDEGLEGEPALSSNPRSHLLCDFEQVAALSERQAGSFRTVGMRRALQGCREKAVRPGQWSAARTAFPLCRGSKPLGLSSPWGLAGSPQAPSPLWCDTSVKPAGSGPAWAPPAVCTVLQCRDWPLCPKSRSPWVALECSPSPFPTARTHYPSSGPGLSLGKARQ